MHLHRVLITHPYTILTTPHLLFILPNFSVCGEHKKTQIKRRVRIHWCTLLIPVDRIIG